jgi:hypothetical protein
VVLPKISENLLVLLQFRLNLFNGYETLPYQSQFHFREYIDIAGDQVRLVGRVGNSGHVFFGQEFPHNERGVYRYIVTVQQPVSVHLLECIDITL